MNPPEGRMRAISLHQPYASAISNRAKKYETRSRDTKVRGLVAIHASKYVDLDRLEELARHDQWKGALFSYYVEMSQNFTDPKQLIAKLPTGCLVAVATIGGSYKTEDVRSGLSGPAGYENAGYRWKETDMGDYTSGRFAWRLDDVYPLPAPIPWKGGQGFFYIPDFRISAIYDERENQLYKHKYDNKHDDKHIHGEIAKGAQCYLDAARYILDYERNSGGQKPDLEEIHHVHLANWPWEHTSWKPSTDPSRNFVKGAAMMLAEKNRLQRLGQYVGA